MEPYTGDNSTRTGPMGRAGSSVDEFVSDVRGRAQMIKEEYIDKGWNKTRDFARENPGKTIVISAAIGMLLGALLARRRG